MASTAEKRAAFRALHAAGCFVLPNPWDFGTTRYLQGLGFKALATTSAGAANALGFADGETPRDAMLTHIRAIVRATDLPVNADFEAGYARDPAGVSESVRLCIETGVAGLSIEDSTHDQVKPLYAIDDAVARMRAARNAIDKAGGDVVLTGRAECFLVGRPDLAETIKRLRAYSDAGADCLYAPAIRTREQIEAVVKAAAPKPVNVLMAWPGDFTVQDLAALGVRRISTGSGLSRAAWGGFLRAARGLAEGKFDGFAGTASAKDLNDFFSDDYKRRSS